MSELRVCALTEGHRSPGRRHRRVRGHVDLGADSRRS